MPVGRAGKRGSHRSPAVPFRYSHHASRPWLHRWWQRSCEPPRSGRRRSPCDQWLEVGAALLPQSRGVVVRRRAGRWPCTASWALAGEPRSRQGDPPAAAARGAKHPPTYWHTDTRPVRLPGCRSPPSPAGAQVTDPRTAATMERPSALWCQCVSTRAKERRLDGTSGTGPPHGTRMAADNGFWDL